MKRSVSEICHYVSYTNGQTRQFIADFKENLYDCLVKYCYINKESRPGFFDFKAEKYISRLFWLLKEIHYEGEYDYYDIQEVFKSICEDVQYYLNDVVDLESSEYGHMTVYVDENNYDGIMVFGPDMIANYTVMTFRQKGRDAALKVFQGR